MTRESKPSLRARLASRAFRRHLIRWFLGHVFRSVDGSLIDRLTSAAIHRIVVLRPNHRLGNIVLLTPLIAELERVFPGAEIDILGAGPAAAEIFEGFRSVRRIYALPRFMVRHPVTTISLIAKLRRVHYDLAIDASRNSNSSRLMLAFVSAHHRIGSLNPASAIEPMIPWSPRHLAMLPVFLLRRALAPEADETAYPTVNIRLTPEERQTAARTLQTLLRTDEDSSSRMILGVFANATGAKCFEESWWLCFLAAIIARHPELTVIELIAADGTSRLGNRFPTYYSSSPRSLAAFISNMTCFVSGDCGVMHLACASGTTTIGLFSVSDASKYAPRGHLSRAVVTGIQSPEQIAQTVIEILKLDLPRCSRPCGV